MNDSPRSLGAASRAETAVRWCAAALLFPYLAAWLGSVLLYMASPVYLDHIEPAVAVITEQWMQGRPLYHGTDSPYVYSLLYGPSCFLNVRLWMGLVGSPILASKLSGGCLALFSAGVFFWMCRRRFGSVIAAAGTGLLAALAYTYASLPQTGATMWDRPDSILLAAVVLGLVSAQMRSVRVAAALLALALAAAVDAKIHGFLYFLPLAALWVQRQGWRAGAGAITAGVALAAAAFMLPGVSLWAYLGWLKLALAHGIEKELVLQNLSAVAGLLLPLAFLPRAFAANRPWRWAAEEKLLGLVAVAALLVSVPASKQGAGPTHLLPFVPYVAYLFASTLNRGELARPLSWGPLVGAAWAVALYGRLFSYTHTVWKSCRPGAGREEVAELRAIMARFDSQHMQMGVGGSLAYSLTWFSPELYRAGAPRVAEPSSCMDMKLAHVDLGAVEGSLHRQEVRYWLVPHGEEPFAMGSFYGGQRLFPPEVTRTFRERYGMVEAGVFFDVYEAKR